MRSNHNTALSDEIGERPRFVFYHRWHQIGWISCGVECDASGRENAIEDEMTAGDVERGGNHLESAQAFGFHKAFDR